MDQQHPQNSLVQQARRLLQQLQMPTIDFDAAMETSRQALHELTPDYPIVSFAPLSMMPHRAEEARVEDVQNTSAQHERTLKSQWPSLEPAATPTRPSSNSLEKSSSSGTDERRLWNEQMRPSRSAGNAQSLTASRMVADSDQRDVRTPKPAQDQGAATTTAAMPSGVAPSESPAALLSSIVDAALSASKTRKPKMGDQVAPVRTEQETGAMNAQTQHRPLENEMLAPNVSTWSEDHSRPIDAQGKSSSSAIELLEQLTHQPMEINPENGANLVAPTNGQLGTDARLPSQSAAAPSLTQQLAAIRPDLVSELEAAAQPHGRAGTPANASNMNDAIQVGEAVPATQVISAIPDAATLVAHVNAALVEQARLHGVDLS